MKWEIVDYGPQFWQLYRAGDAYFLAVRCQNSFVEFELLLQISPTEYREYHALGHVYLEYLAARVNYWQSEYKSRNQSQQYREEVQQAVSEWRAARDGAYL